MSRTLLGLLTTTLLGLSACGGNADPDDPGSDPTDPTDVTDPTGPTGPTDPTDPTDPAGITWYGDVSHIVQTHCVACHQDGSIGPMVLDTYDAAVTWGPSMQHAVAERTMPPWLATADGTCGDFVDPRWMEQDEIDILSEWVEGGMLEGDPADGPTMVAPEPPALSSVDITVTTPVFEPVVTGGALAANDEYRCFLIEDPTDSEVFLTGFEVLPGNLGMVHHVLVMPVDPIASGYNGVPNGVQIDQLNGADGRDGWECFGTTGGAIREKGVPVVWAPGMGAVEYPSNAGVRLAADDVLVVQVHYNLVDPALHGQTDSTTVHLRTADTVDLEAVFALPDALLDSLFSGSPDVLPPNESSYSYSFGLSGADALAYADVNPISQADGYKLLGVMPHMHELGRSETVTIEHTDGTSTCAVDVPDWDFGWQLFYMYETPLDIALSDTINIECVYDTMGVSDPTLPGWGTHNEMCLAVLMLGIEP